MNNRLPDLSEFLDDDSAPKSPVMTPALKKAILGQDTETPSNTEDGQWKEFLENVNAMKGNPVTGTSMVKVDTNIRNTLRLCTIEGASIQVMVNAILRTFLKVHSEKFKQLAFNSTVL